MYTSTDSLRVSVGIGRRIVPQPSAAGLSYLTSKSPCIPSFASSAPKAGHSISYPRLYRAGVSLRHSASRKLAHSRSAYVRPRKVRSKRLRSEQGVLPRRTRTARRGRCLRGDADIRRRTRCKGRCFAVPVSNGGKAGASSLGVHRRESPASRGFLSRSSERGWQRQWPAWPAPALPRELLCSFRPRSRRTQHRSGVPRSRRLTIGSLGAAHGGQSSHAQDRFLQLIQLQLAARVPKS